eukprot:TRINITY_DN3732_c0_g1_i2.p1 TRINITY_DN3732_c0_g1~~TRINITY_DN3732_c0_g1_i2.p1  ORF type:complete len:220 (+),score=63.56 TRINITY_DN3732_c0_g1_i2:215-874(+)
MTIKNPSTQLVLAYSLLQIFLGQIGMVWISVCSAGRHRSWSISIPVLAAGNGFFGLYAVLTRKKSCAMSLFVSSLMITAVNIPLAVVSRNVACFGKDCPKYESPTTLTQDGVDGLTGFLVLVPLLISIAFMTSLYRFAMKPQLNEEIDEDEEAKEQARQMHILFEESSLAFDDNKEKSEGDSRKPSNSSSGEKNSSFGSRDFESDEEELEEKPLMSRQK